MPRVWHDCDPGHDDALAMMLCLASPDIEVVGISTVHGNQEARKTYLNALRILFISGRQDLIHSIPIIPGEEKPLVRPGQTCPEIHGQTGLGGVDWGDVDQQMRDAGIDLAYPHEQGGDIVADAIHKAFVSSDEPLILLVTGCHTNIAHYFTKYPSDGETGRVSVVAMGGSICAVGNTGPWQEFNIQIDPEAFLAVARALHREDKPLVTIVPLDVTHTVLATPDVFERISGGRFLSTVSQFLSFFKETYRKVFHFDAPPVHDPVAAFYIMRPSLFDVRPMRVAIETEGRYTSGALCPQRYDNVTPWCDTSELYHMNVCMAVDVGAFWDEMINALYRLARDSPLK